MRSLPKLFSPRAQLRGNLDKKYPMSGQRSRRLCHMKPPLCFIKRRCLPQVLLAKTRFDQKDWSQCHDFALQQRAGVHAFIHLILRAHRATLDQKPRVRLQWEMMQRRQQYLASTVNSISGVSRGRARCPRTTTLGKTAECDSRAKSATFFPKKDSKRVSYAVPYSTCAASGFCLTWCGLRTTVSVRAAIKGYGDRPPNVIYRTSHYTTVQRLFG